MAIEKMKSDSTKRHSPWMASHAITLTVLLTIVACNRTNAPNSAEPASETLSQPVAPIEPQSYEASAEDLLSQRLTSEECEQGWIRLFDGSTLLGWEIAGEANWRIEDGTIVVDAGKPSLLCTSMPWLNYELELEFKADPETNSGVFLRTPLEPTDVATECYEVNIAPPSNPFPTASVVKRQKTEGATTSGEWQKMSISLLDSQLSISLDGKLVTEYPDELELNEGRIGLQHNSGAVAFRNIRLKPLGLEALIDKDLSKWTQYPDMGGKVSVNDDNELQIQGRTQLETKESHGNFVLTAQYRLPTSEINSGIFFRCIPGDEMMGYECQVNDGFKDNNRLLPADCGTGGIFRRQDARVVAGEIDQWNAILLKTHDRSMAVWVNGVQVSHWVDDREPNENPRKGSRVDPGTIILQGHDEGTDAKFKNIKVSK
jgi:Domain of Unknown Function (DUF1080)